jgi:hypothetical protein
MGQRANVKARIAGSDVGGQLYLDTEQVIFRGEKNRVAIPVQGIKSARADGGTLVLIVGREKYEFVMGPVAQRWADRITNPRTLIQKLGVRPDSVMAYIGERDSELLSELERTSRAVQSELMRRDYDLVFVGIETPEELDRLDGVREWIKSNGSIWLIFPKGRRDLKDETIISKAKINGLVDNKIARISDRLTGMKLVIPLSLRK